MFLSMTRPDNDGPCEFCTRLTCVLLNFSPLACHRVQSIDNTAVMMIHMRASHQQTHVCYSLTRSLFSFTSKKLSPSAGSGATNSILDAVTLANWIVCLRPFSVLNEVSRGLEAFQNERIPWVKASFELSKVLKKMLAGVSRMLYHICSF